MLYIKTIALLPSSYSLSYIFVTILGEDPLYRLYTWRKAVDYFGKFISNIRSRIKIIGIYFLVGGRREGWGWGMGRGGRVEGDG